MATALATMDSERVALIKRTVCRGGTDDELRLFLHACERTGLDPLMRQVYAVKRWDKTLQREVMSIQTGIDGYRLIAERTGKYAPGREPVYEYGDDGRVVAATSYVKKQTADGTWHEVAASARYDEYVQRAKDGKPTRFWVQMPHVMLAKVAEALALRRAFPMELSGIYTAEEMGQADTDHGDRPADPETTVTVNGKQVQTAGVTRDQLTAIGGLVKQLDAQQGAGTAKALLPDGVTSTLGLTAEAAVEYVAALQAALATEGAA